MDEDRSTEVNSVIRKGVVFLAAFAVAVAVGTWIVVKVLGLNTDNSSDSALGLQPVPVSPLPSTALAVPHHQHPSGASETTGAGVPADQGHAAHGLHLTITPLVARPMEHLNITGTYAGHDNVSLQVQRLEGGVWADFPTQAQVDMGTFETYVETSHPGPNRFRVYDPSSGKSSNVVTISIR